MKKSFFHIVVICFFCLYSNISNAQTPDWLWAKSEGGTSTEYSPSVAVDASGNAYFTGWFASPIIVFGDDTLMSAGSTDLFLAKYDPYGNVLWAICAGGTDDDKVLSIAVDAHGNTYLTGFFYSSTIIFSTDTLTNTGERDIFLVKYDASGNVLWAKNEGGTGEDGGFSVAVDTSGNPFVAGWFVSPSITFGEYVLWNAGSGDLFLTKYDTSGNVLWATSAGGTGGETAHSVVVDDSGNPYLTGRFTSPTLKFGSDTLTNAGSADLFLAKYDANGNVLWATSAGGIDSDYALSIAVDGSGNSYLAGCFYSYTITFGTNTLTNTGKTDLFLAKYDANGNVIWVISTVGTGSEAAYSVAVDPSGNSYLAGIFSSSTLTFGSYILTNTGDFDVFIAKYNTSGNVLWASSVAGALHDYATSVALDDLGNSYLTGYFFSPTLTFGSFILTNAGSFDVFIAKLETTITGINDVNSSLNVTVFPNPAFTTITIETPAPSQLSILNLNGQELLKQTITEPKTVIDISSLPNGVYFVRVTGEKSVGVGKFVKQ